MRQPLCKLTEIPETGTKLVPFFGREVHVYRVGREIRAAVNVCLHFGGPLECKGQRLVCPWHQAAFDMDTGACLAGPAPGESRLMFLSTKVENDSLIYVWAE
jgi:nitrite reductase/ring-hydroxylating ferredoxin subunit